MHLLLFVFFVEHLCFPLQYYIVLIINPKYVHLSTSLMFESLHVVLSTSIVCSLMLSI